MKRITTLLLLLALGGTTATAQTLFKGLNHTAFGQATLVSNDSILVVSNIGDSGLDGVEIETGAADYLCVSLGLDDLSEGQVTINGYGSGASPRSTLIMTRSGAEINFTYDEIFSQPHTVRIYNDDQMVAEVSGLIGPIVVTIPEPIPWPSPIPIDVFRGDHAADLFGTAVGLGGDAEITVMGAGITAITGDRFAIITAGVPPIRLSRVRVAAGDITGDGIDELFLAGHTVGKFGLPHTALGQVQLDVKGAAITLANLGSSGEDGISTEFAPGTVALRTDLEPLAVDAGDYVVWRAGLGTSGALLSSESLLMGFAINGNTAGGSEIEVAVDAVTGLGWDTFTYQLVHGGEVRRERTIANGTSVRFRNSLVTGFGRATASSNGWEGFFVEVLRGNQVLELRFLPVGGVDSSSLMILNNDILAASLIGGLSPTITGIIAILIGAPIADAHTAEATQASVDGDLPGAFALHPAYPNPFGGAGGFDQATVGFELSESAEVAVEVFDLLGRSVAVLVNAELEAGRHTATFDGRGLPSGVYVVRMRAGAFMASQRMTLVR